MTMWGQDKNEFDETTKRAFGGTMVESRSCQEELRLSLVDAAAAAAAAVVVVAGLVVNTCHHLSVSVATTVAQSSASVVQMILVEIQTTAAFVAAFVVAAFVVAVVVVVAAVAVVVPRTDSAASVHHCRRLLMSSLDFVAGSPTMAYYDSRNSYWDCSAASFVPGLGAIGAHPPDWIDLRVSPCLVARNEV